MYSVQDRKLRSLCYRRSRKALQMKSKNCKFEAPKLTVQRCSESLILQQLDSMIDLA